MSCVIHDVPDITPEEYERRRREILGPEAPPKRRRGRRPGSKGVERVRNVYGFEEYLCFGCKSWLQRDHFFLKRKHKFGLSPYCRRCVAGQRRERKAVTTS